ncbi:MAG: four helix bundle protein [Patescibacteria group bacterium]
MPRVERFGIGTRIDSLFLDLLELLRKATYTSLQQKITVLEETNILIDSLRFFLQLAWEARLMKDEPYAKLGIAIEEIGRQVGAWKLGLIAKTSPRREERY